MAVPRVLPRRPRRDAGRRRLAAEEVALSSTLAAQLERGRFRLDVELHWEERVAVLFGPSGSGKSTLLEVALGLVPGARARVQIGGTWLEDGTRSLRLRPEQRRLGWVPQDPTLMPHLDVAGNLALGRARAGERSGAALERAVEVLEIGALLQHRVDALSGGERQRVALARALASGPAALLLDEPLAALDAPLRARVLPYLLRVRDELGLPMLYITHDPDEAMLIGEYVAVLDAGRVVATGPAREVLWSRAVRPLSEALGLENVLECAAETTSVIGTSGGLRLHVPDGHTPGERVRVGVRAEDLLLASEVPDRISARNALPVRVARVEESGDEVLVHLATADPELELIARVTAGAARALSLEPGRELVAIVKAHAIRRLA